MHNNNMCITTGGKPLCAGCPSKKRYNPHFFAGRAHTHTLTKKKEVPVPREKGTRTTMNKIQCINRIDQLHTPIHITPNIFQKTREPTLRAIPHDGTINIHYHKKCKSTVLIANCVAFKYKSTSLAYGSTYNRATVVYNRASTCLKSCKIKKTNHNTSWFCHTTFSTHFSQRYLRVSA